MKRFYSLLSIFDEKFALGIDGNSASFSITHFNIGQKKGDQTSSFASFAGQILLGTLSRSRKAKRCTRRQNANVACER